MITKILALKVASGFTVINLLICGSVGAASSNSSEVGGESTKKECPVEKGHRHPSYQVFRHTTQMPSLKVLDNQTLHVGLTTIDTTWQKPCSARDTKALAKELGLPVMTVTNALKRFSRQGPLSAMNASNGIQILTVDYKYLLEKFSNPALSAKLPQQQAEAMQALETADIVKAWAIFQSLPKPQAPGPLHLQVLKD